MFFIEYGIEHQTIYWLMSVIVGVLLIVTVSQFVLLWFLHKYASKYFYDVNNNKGSNNKN